MGVEYGLAGAVDGDSWTFRFTRPSGAESALHVAYAAAGRCFTVTNDAGTVVATQCGQDGVVVFALETHRCMEDAAGGWMMRVMK
ncbi:MAG: hypothetical protein HY904_18925, partial [Deltaproteobacteria bacterium]|nr:hypothetical protein [Deltaproteobacteria bacterium]